MCIYIYIYTHIYILCLIFYLSIYLSIDLCIYVFMCLCVYLHLHLYLYLFTHSFSRYPEPQIAVRLTGFGAPNKRFMGQERFKVFWRVACSLLLFAKKQQDSGKQNYRCSSKLRWGVRFLKHGLWISEAWKMRCTVAPAGAA